MNIVVPDGVEALVARLPARLDVGDGPRVEIEQRPAALCFRCQTWRPILVDRVTEAIDGEIGAGERQRRFKPF